MEKGEREIRRESMQEGGPWGIAVHTVYLHHYKLQSGSQPLLHIISLYTVLCISTLCCQVRNECI